MDLVDMRQLADLVRERWTPPAAGDKVVAHALPEQRIVEQLLALSYRASLMREEQRPVVFRLILCPPQLLPADAGPPLGLHRLVFSEPRPFSAHELRRLSPAATYHRGLIGVLHDAEHGLRIWGIVQSGPRWLQEAHGGREVAPAMPRALVVRMMGPGRMSVAQGATVLASVDNTRATTPLFNVFTAKWLYERFSDVRGELQELHNRDRAAHGQLWAPLDENLSRLLAQQVMKRLIATVQAAGHGGTLLIVPPDCAAAVLEGDDHLRLKYGFVDEEPRSRFRTLMIRLMNTMADIGGQQSVADPPVVAWQHYEQMHQRRLSNLDEGFFEMAHLIAGLAAVDGAVVLTKRMELLGFGAEIGGSLLDVPDVARALDVEGEQFEIEPTTDVGTRHRSAYRLCHAVQDALAIVISQDGEVRFVAWKDGRVIYWIHDMARLVR